jgi:hypothetical protein
MIQYGEKLVLLSQAATLVGSALPSTPPSASSPYTGAQKTAAARASLQRALDNYRTGQIHLPTHEDSFDTASTASFGETHGPELARINTSDFRAAAVPNVPITPPAHTEAAPGTFAPPAGPPPTHPAAAAHGASGPSFPSPSPATGSTTSAIPIPVPATHSTGPAGATPLSPPLDPKKLNQAPAPLPTSPEGSTTVVDTAVTSPDVTSPLAGITPTVAETGVPISAGGKGPGPASGSLADLRRERFGTADVSPGVSLGPSATSGAPPAFAGAVHHETAEEEKRRLEREERERVLGANTAQGPSAAPAYETAEDEKKRLERQERERVLATGGNQQSGPNPGSRRDTGDDGKGEDLPPYQEPF